MLMASDYSLPDEATYIWLAEQLGIVSESETNIIWNVTVTAGDTFGKDTEGVLIPLTSKRKSKVIPLGHLTELKKDDQITCMVLTEKKDQFNAWLAKSVFSSNTIS